MVSQGVVIEVIYKNDPSRVTALLLRSESPDHDPLYLFMQILEEQGVISSDMTEEGWTWGQILNALGRETLEKGYLKAEHPLMYRFPAEQRAKKTEIIQDFLEDKSYEREDDD